MVFGKLKTRSTHLLRLYATLVLIAGHFLYAIGSPIGMTPLAVTAGRPAGSIDMSELERINLYNGQLNLTMPLLTVGGRGRISHTLALAIQRRVHVVNTPIDRCSSGFCTEGCFPETCGTDFVKSISVPISRTAGYGPGKLWGMREGVSLRDPNGNFISYVSSLTRFTFTMPDGTDYELRDKNSDGKPFEWSGFSAPAGFPRGTEFVTADGTSATFYSSDPIVDRRPGQFTENPIPPYCGGLAQCSSIDSASGFVMLADGTRYDISNGLTTRMSDSNGNRIDFQYTPMQVPTGGSGTFLTSITDPLGRQVTISYGFITGTGYDEIQYKGINDVSRSIKVYRQTLEATLASGGTLLTKGQLYPELNPNDNTKDNPNVVSRVELANGRSYFFKYNHYGEPARLELPAGGVIEYTFESGVLNGPASGLYGGVSQISTQEAFLYRRLAERRTYVGGNLIGFTRYSKSDIWNGLGITKTAPLPHIEVKSYEAQNSTCYAANTCQVLGVERHYFFHSAAQSYAGSPLSGNFKLSRYPFWQHGREFKFEALDIDGTTVLQRQEMTWDQSHSGWWTSISAPEPPNNPKIVETKFTVIAGGGSFVTKKSSKHPSTGVAAFDQFNNQTDLWEYDFGNGAPGLLLRHTHTDFVTATSYTGAPLSSGGGGAHLRRLPRAQTVFSVNPSNNQDVAVVAASETIYDEPTYVAAPYPSLTGWVDPARIARGNPTTSKAWLNFNGTTLQAYDPINGTFISTHSVYDQSGNVIKSIDALGRESTLDFTDANGTNTDGHHAFATKSTSPIPDSSGTYASNSAFVSNTTFDHSTGLIISSIDILGQETTVEYNDSLSRPTRVVPPAGGSEIIFEYEDDPANTHSPGTVYNKVRKQIDENTWEEGFTYFDGLGRKIKRRSHDAQGDIFSETVYDSLGRVTKSAAPYHSGDEKRWVETTYDALGRPKETISPKIASEPVAAKITSEYSACALGFVVVGTNQSGNKSRSIVNALGKVIRVDEANGANDLGPVDAPLQPTYYKYDVLGQLVRVTQGSQNPDVTGFNSQLLHQSRFFLFDSLGRLIRAKQPEQDTNSNLTIVDPVTGNSTWSTGFKHFANGNVETTTDAKGVVSTISYDNLNRVRQRSYTVPTTTDPKKITAATSTVSFKYDGYLSPAPNNQNPTVVEFASGNLTEVSNGVSVTQSTSFNNLGRITASQQVTDGQVYAFTYEYNLAGALKKEVYPSGRTITSGFDTDGDLSSVSSTLPNQTAVLIASQIRYTARGTVDQFKFGNNRWETYKSNAREQVTEIALGTSSTDTSLWKVQYDYGRFNPDGSIDVAKNDGNVIRQTITVPGVTAPFIQTYQYDSLSRLAEALEKSGTNENWKQTFGYDRYGNRNSFAYLINQAAVTLNATNNPTIDSWTNRIASGQGYDYDLNGNIIQDAQSRKFGFDAENRQQEIKNASNQVIATYDYDGNGRRIKKNATTEQTVFVYDARGKLIAEYSNQPSGTGISYITGDNLSSPRAISNSNGDVISRRDFMPFGELISVSRSINQKYGVDDGLRKGFTGYERDTESSLNFAEARYYNDLQGRFTTVDPLMASGAAINPQTFNRYIYAGNNPTLRTDPNGEAWYVRWRDASINEGGGQILRYEWHSKYRPDLTPARDFIIRFNHGKVQGLMALDPFEKRYKIVSSVEEGRAAFEQFRLEALRNRLVGAAEAMSLSLDFLSAGDLASVDRNSEQYKLGRNVGNIGSGLAAITPWGLTNLLMKAFGKAGKVAVHQIHNASPQLKAITQLDWSKVSKAGETRVDHVALHNVDNALKKVHGVFLEDGVALTKEAWEKAQQMGLQPVLENGADILVVPMGRQVGWLGGIAGSEAAIPLHSVRIILEHGTNKIITSMPF